MAETTIVKLSAYIPAFQLAGADIWIANEAPTGLTAPKGTLFLNTSATTTTTRLYVNTDGGTTWAYFTASA